MPPLRLLAEFLLVKYTLLLAIDLKVQQKYY